MSPWYSPELLRNLPQFGGFTDTSTTEFASDLSGRAMASSSETHNGSHEQEAEETRFAPDESKSNTKTKKGGVQQPEGLTVDQYLLASPRNTLSVHIGYTTSVHSLRSLCWISYDISSEMRLRDLFLLHHLNGGPQPHDNVALQQIDRCFLRHIDGTDTYWFSEQDITRIMDTNWMFKDDEIWLGCSTR